MNIHVPDDPLFIDDENGPLGDPFRPEDIVEESHVPVGPEIAQDGKGGIEAFGPRLKCRQVIDKNTQNLSVKVRETRLQFLVRGQLPASCRGKGRREEGDQHIFLAFVITEGDLPSQCAGQGKFGGLLPDLNIVGRL